MAQIRNLVPVSFGISWEQMVADDFAIKTERIAGLIGQNVEKARSEFRAFYGAQDVIWHRSLNICLSLAAAGERMPWEQTGD